MNEGAAGGRSVYGMKLAQSRPASVSWVPPSGGLGTVMLQLRPPVGQPGPGVDVYLDGSAILSYSQEGEAETVEFIDELAYIYPHQLVDLPCRDEIRAVLAEQGLELPSVGSLPAAAAMRGFSRGGRPSSRTYIRLRAGLAVGYTHDVIGDGTETIGYSPDGLALGIEFLNWENGVFLRGLPCKDEVERLLGRAGIPISDPSDPSRCRPRLVGINGYLDPKEWAGRDRWYAEVEAGTRDPRDILFRNRPAAVDPDYRSFQIDYVDGRGSEERDISGDGSVVLIYTDDGLVKSVEFRRLDPPPSLAGVPQAELVADILRFQGIAVGM